MQPVLRPVSIPPAVARAARVMLIAKHARWDGALHPEDGNHAVYHREVRTILEGLGVDLTVADSYEALFDRQPVDFVIPLFNRGGFLNSEMLLPLLCTRLGIPFLGASPILRGLADDKHLTKLEARARGVPTGDWAIYRRGAPVREQDCPKAARWVIKPNASSASWGVRDATDWAGIKAAVEALHDEGHDVIVEPFLNGSDVEVPMVTIAGEPTFLPMMLFEQADPGRLRTYGEKRDLVERVDAYQLAIFDDPYWRPRIEALARRMSEIYRPFDYGRFEFRLDLDAGDLRLLEVNLNCNLWSQKVFGRAATAAGWTQSELIETILAEGLRRHGLLERAIDLAA